MYASLKNTLKLQGYGLWRKEHDGDRWIAAAALMHDLPLISHDRIFHAVPDLQLISEATT